MACPLVALTGYAPEEGASSIFDRYLLKPVDPDELLKILGELSDLRALRDVHRRRFPDSCGPVSTLTTSGGGGIRTHGWLAPSTVFKTVPPPFLIH